MVLVIWLCSILLAVIIGSRKEAGASGFFLGLLLGPLGVLIILAMDGNRPECPFCREKVHPKALRCPHCQKDFAQG